METDPQERPARLLLDVKELHEEHYSHLMATLGRLGVAYAPIYGPPAADKRSIARFAGEPQPFETEPGQSPDYAVAYDDLAATAALHPDEFTDAGAAARAWRGLNRYMHQSYPDMVEIPEPGGIPVLPEKRLLSFNGLSGLANDELLKHSGLRYAASFGNKSYYLLRLTLEHKKRQIEQHTAAVARTAGD